MPFDTANFNNTRSGAGNVSAAGVEEVGNVNDMGLFGRIINDRHAISHHRCDHNVDGGTHRGNIEINGIANQTVFSFNKNVSVFDLYVGPKCLKPFDVLVDGTNTKITTARPTDFGLTKTG